MRIARLPLLLEKSGVVAVQFLAGYPERTGQSRILNAVILLGARAAIFNNERATTP